MTTDHEALARRFAFGALGRGRPLYWLSLEAGALYPDPRVPAQLPSHVLGLRQIDGDRRTTEHLALVEGHADWLQPLDVAEEYRVPDIDGGLPPSAQPSRTTS